LSASATDTDVLIAGAGPTGLVLALWLQRLGVRVRIVDKVAEPGTTSRALVIHARILELYHQIGIAEAVAAQALRFVAVNLWYAAGARIFLGDGRRREPPYMLIFPGTSMSAFSSSGSGSTFVSNGYRGRGFEDREIVWRSG
jgi:2-polyprenyl-6-methoxyphenol hydroxylase-like FAD-dependent oxidoreductase